MRARQSGVNVAAVGFAAAGRCGASPVQRPLRTIAALLACVSLGAGLFAACTAQAQTSARTQWQLRPAGRSSGRLAADAPLARLGAGNARAARSALFGKRAPAARRLAAAAQAGGNAKIEGVVTAAESKEPVAGIEVCAYTPEEEFSEEFAEECAETGLTGGYQISGLAPGQYDVEFFAPDESGQDYVTQYYNGKANEAEADPVTLGSKEEEVVKEVNAALIKGADIQGKVVAAGTKAPLAEVLVCAFDSAHETARCTLTDAGGNYAVIGLAVDSYEVQFSSIENEYATQYYNGKLRLAEAEAVEVLVPGSVASGIDAELHALPVAIHSPVIEGGAPTQGLPLSVKPGSWSGEPTSVIDEWGRCNTAGENCFTIAEGHGYTPTAEDVGHTLRIREKATNEFGEGTEAFSAPTAVVLAPPPPVLITKPTILGTPVQGTPLELVPGTWSNQPTSVTDEWGRCDTTGEKCFTIAKGHSYTPTAEDVGHRLRIREKAANEFGESKEAFSAPTAIVLALAHEGTGSAPGQTGGGPASPAPVGSIGVGGGTGVLASIASAPSTAQLKSLLLSVLAPRGAAAKVAALRKRRSYTVSFVSLAAGRLSVSWYAQPKGTHLGRAKPLLVGSGSVSTKAGAATKLKIALTAAGRALLAHGVQPTLTAKGVLTSSGQPALHETRSFKLKH